MKRFKRFEDIPVWQHARELVKAIYRVARSGEFSRDRGLVDQIRRAAVSITSNIAEGHERGTTTDLILFLYYAKGSAGEVRSQLYNAEDAGYLRAQCRKIGWEIYSWVTSMQAPDFDRGPKYNVSKPVSESKWEKIMTQFGIVRLPNGRHVDARNSRRPDGMPAARNG